MKSTAGERAYASHWLDTHNQISWIVVVGYQAGAQLVGPFPTCDLAEDYIKNCSQKHRDIADLFGNGGDPTFEIQRMGMPTNR